MREFVEDLETALTKYLSLVTDGGSADLLDQLVKDLDGFYDCAAGSNNLELFRLTCQNHPLHISALEDPFTERAFTKPRGYAGDAVMLDYIYRQSELNLSKLGTLFNRLTTRASTARSIIWRRDHIAREIVKTVQETKNARILAVASGHLRELDVVRMSTSRNDFEIVAIDQDPQSLQEAAVSYPEFRLRPLSAPISSLFKKGHSARYDLIYSAGLFDYLPTGTAERLIECLVDMISPFGRLLIGNYAPENYGRGYMEGIMGWSLLYRGEADMKALLHNNQECSIYRDEPGNVVYLEAGSSHGMTSHMC